MQAFLFRRLEIDGINYYQYYDERDDFENSDDFSLFSDYDHRNSSEYFYIDKDSDIELKDPILLNIYVDSEKGLERIEKTQVFSPLYDKFKEKYGTIDFELRPINEIVSEVGKSVLYQKYAVTKLVKQLYLNQEIMMSNLPVDLKRKQKSNILFHGVSGSGKKSIIEIIEKNLSIPYADIIISGELKKDLAVVMDQLLEKSIDDEEASRGIVFIRDNFDNLTELFDDKTYNVPTFFTSQEVIAYGEHKIDFRTLTFVILFDEKYDFDDEDLKEMMRLTDCECDVEPERLFDSSKYRILFSENGRLRHYERFLAQYGKKMVIDEKSLKRIIRASSTVDLGMNLLNSIIDTIMKSALEDGIDDVYINKACADLFVPIIMSYSIKKDDKKKINKSKEDIFNEELKGVYDLVTQNVIGQDKQVKAILYTILQNRRMANKKELNDPKKYIKNILIRGESGSGKTMIVENISKALNIPVFIADATKYTEEGYVGSSVSEMLINIYHAAGDDQEEAQKGILFIDELDKKVNNENNSSDVSRGAVLDGLLKIIEGAVIPINVGNRLQEQIIMFDTSRLTVICSGAFEGIEKYRDKRLGKTKKMGFGNQIEETNNNETIGTDENKIIDADYVQYGMNKQFMARFPLMIELSKNTVESLVNIMKNSASSALKIEKYILEDRGLSIEYEESFYEELAKEALALKVGARGISKALERVLTSIHIEDIDAKEVSKVVFNGEVVHDPSKIVLIPRKHDKQKSIK